MMAMLSVEQLAGCWESLAATSRHELRVRDSRLVAFDSLQLPANGTAAVVHGVVDSATFADGLFFFNVTAAPRRWLLNFTSIALNSMNGTETDLESRSPPAPLSLRRSSASPCLGDAAPPSVPAGASAAQQWSLFAVGTLLLLCLVALAVVLRRRKLQRLARLRSESSGALAELESRDESGVVKLQI